MARDRDGAELERLLTERGSSLLAAATALAGNRQDGEDLLQAALERVLRKPRHLDHDSDGQGDVEGYLRRVLYNLAADAIEIDTLTDARNGNFGFIMGSTAANPATSPAPNALSGVHASSEVDWSYDGVLLQHGYSATGKLVYTVAIGPQGESGAAYPARIRWHNSLTGGVSGPNPTLTCDNAGFSYPSWKQSVTKALSCHLFTLGGNQQVAGVDTIKLIRKPVIGEGETIRQTLWVDPKTYLPLRISTTFTEAHGRIATLTRAFRWLSPTKANLATLHAAEQRGVIPTSFRALPSTDLPLPGFDAPGSPG